MRTKKRKALKDGKDRATYVLKWRPSSSKREREREDETDAKKKRTNGEWL